MFQKYLERERKRKEERTVYQTRRVVVPKTHSGEVPVQERIARNVRVPRLRKAALRTILRSPQGVLVEVCEDVLPVLLSLLLDREDALLFKAVERMAKVAENRDLLLTYFKCYVFNDFPLAEKFLRMLLRVLPAWVYARKAALSALLPASCLRERVLGLEEPVENTEIDLARISWAEPGTPK